MKKSNLPVTLKSRQLYFMHFVFVWAILGMATEVAQRNLKWYSLLVVIVLGIIELGIFVSIKNGSMRRDRH